MYEGKLNIVQNEMNCMDIDILGISEMKWISSGHFRSANSTVMYWGHSDVLGAQGTQKEWRGNDRNKLRV
jgi:hypothetical protein